MMKTQQLTKIFLSAVLTMVAMVGYSQTDTTIVLNPGEWIPADTGYYIAGVDKDLIGDDGVTEHYDGCYDAYGDADHREGGMQFGWEYGEVIIFRGCDTDPSTVDDVIKGTQPEENWPEVGNIIQLGKHKYAGTDSADLGGYLISPEITDISKLEVKVSTDLSMNGREIYMMIEASADGGETWEYLDNTSGTAWIRQQLTNQGGDIHTYTTESGNAGFDEIVALSRTEPIKIRIHTFPAPADDTGERLKIWEVTIEAKTVPAGGGGGGSDILSSSLQDTRSFTIQDGEFVATKGLELSVYTLSGVQIGAGKAVPVCNKGLYIVRTSDGQTQKIYLK